MKVKYHKLAPHSYMYNIYDGDIVVFSSTDWGEVAAYLRSWNNQK